MTPAAKRDEWRRLAEAATEDPWYCGGMIGDIGKPLAHFIHDKGRQIVALSETFSADYSGRDKDMRFIASAREAVPALLSDITEAEAERDAARAELERLRPALETSG